MWIIFDAFMAGWMFRFLMAQLGVPVSESAREPWALAVTATLLCLNIGSAFVSLSLKREQWRKD